MEQKAALQMLGPTDSCLLQGEGSYQTVQSHHLGQIQARFPQDTYNTWLINI